MNTLKLFIDININVKITYDIILYYILISEVLSMVKVNGVDPMIWASRVLKLEMYLWGRILPKI